MLLNYLKMAWKVLLRRKFFTFISLFGISFTLMILLVVVALFDHVAAPHTPEKRLDRLLFVNYVRIAFKTNGTQNSPASYYFLDKYVRPLQTPAQVAICSGFHNNPGYVGSRKLNLDLRYTDEAFWQVLDFDFRAGRPYTAQELKAAAHVVVINESTARQYFETDEAAVGRSIELNQTNYRVVGVVADVPAMRFNSYADVWLPLTTRTEDLRQVRLDGDYTGIILAKKPTDIPAIQAEFNSMVRRVPLLNPDAKQLYVYADPLLVSSFTRQFVRIFNGDQESDGVLFLYSVLGGLALLFMLLPAINLVNINVSRILDRASEIGVRKAFGATGRALVGQFLVENIFLTLLGSLLGLALAALVLALINDAHLIAYAQLALNFRIFGWALLAALFFGLLSGVYPALRMSRLLPAQALKSGLK